jgi:hypothetical protein
LPCSDATICRAGQCVSCGPREQRCDNRCVNTQSDVSHCGGCNAPACADGETCRGGSCMRTSNCRPGHNYACGSLGECTKNRAECEGR